MSTEPQTFVYASYIRTTPERLWEALTSGEFSERYWFGFRIEGEWRAGGRLRIASPEGHKQFGDVVGEVLECDPPRKLVYTFENTVQPPEIAAKRNGPSRVTYELTPMGAQVRLRLVHENLLPDDLESDPNTFRGVNNGWAAILSSLKSLLETGEPITFGLPHHPKEA